jgi:hypothetical protein
MYVLPSYVHLLNGGVVGIKMLLVSEACDVILISNGGPDVLGRLVD